MTHARHGERAGRSGAAPEGDAQPGDLRGDLRRRLRQQPRLGLRQKRRLRRRELERPLHTHARQRGQAQRIRLARPQEKVVRTES